MKIGIITQNLESPIAKVLGIITEAKSSLEKEYFNADNFEPSYIPQHTLDALLIHGQSETDAGLAKAIRKHTAIPIIYFTTDLTKETYTPTLTEKNIEVYHIFERQNQRGAEKLFDRLKELGEQK